jgi:hypothetical protein
MVEFMIRAPLTYRPLHWTKEQLAHLREIERDFHVRAFGEELARVNLELTIEQRHRYLAWMRETARRHGVKTGRSHEVFRNDREIRET